MIHVKRFSSEQMLFRVTEWVLRFLNNTRNKVKITGRIYVEEMEHVRNCWIMAVQAEFREASCYKETVESLGAIERDDIVKCSFRFATRS